MRCIVNGHDVPCGTIGPPAMNYGQHRRWEGMETCTYRCVLTTDEFLQKVAQPFSRFAREVANDIAAHSDDWPEPAFIRFRELEFPILPVLLDQYPELLADLLKWADLSLLNWIDESATPAAGETLYPINSIDRCRVGSDAVTIEGVAYEVPAVE